MFDLRSRLRDPAIIQGNLMKNNYNEGGYFKPVDPRELSTPAQLKRISYYVVTSEKENLLHLTPIFR